MDAPDGPPITRRRLMQGAAGAGLLPLAGCGGGGWHGTDVSGRLPDLALRMTDASTGAAVDARAYRGRVALLYFGYASCPDVCPTTLADLARVLDGLGPAADRVRVLFVTVDPARDTAEVLAAFTAQFAPAPRMTGLRGTPDDLARLAARYRVAWSVTPATADAPEQVTHSALVYAFGVGGAARLLLPFATPPDIDVAGSVADLRRLTA